MENSFLTSLPVAHRGLHDGDVPENTMPAFLAAARKGYAIETDVRLSKDGKPFLFHDDHLSRLTGHSGAFFDYTAQELSAIRVAGKEPIPTLETFLKELNGACPILLEIKNVPQWNTKEFIKKVSDAFESYRGEYAVQSFNPAYVKAYKKLRPAIACGLLATALSSKADFGGSPLWRFKAYAVKHMCFNRTAKPDFISYRFADYPNRATDKFKGVKLGWTVRSVQDEEYARKYCDNIIFEGYEAKIPQK